MTGIINSTRRSSPRHPNINIITINVLSKIFNKRRAIALTPRVSVCEAALHTADVAEVRDRGCYRIFYQDVPVAAGGAWVNSGKT